MSVPDQHWPTSVHGYAIGAELGHGAFSHVCRCKREGENCTYAIKIVSKGLISASSDHERFQREVNAMAFLRHPNLVALYDFFWDDANYYLVTDFCQGGELFRYIVENTKIDETVAAGLFLQIARGIEYCHSYQIAHRDLKPENVLLTTFPQLKVADFGLCGFMSPSRLMNTFCGSPCYCAPELITRVEYDGRQSDIWGLGVILYAMVTGRLPWNTANHAIMVRQIQKADFRFPTHVSLACQNLITSMLRPLPADRLSVEKICEHPWLRMARIPNPKKSYFAKSQTLKRLRAMSVDELESNHGAWTDQEITSPFVEDGLHDDEDDRELVRPVRPRTISTSASAPVDLIVQPVKMRVVGKMSVSALKAASPAPRRPVFTAQPPPSRLLN
jgi:serine/threonine protein kinase